MPKWCWTAALLTPEWRVYRLAQTVHNTTSDTHTPPKETGMKKWQSSKWTIPNDALTLNIRYEIELLILAPILCTVLIVRKPSWFYLFYLYISSGDHTRAIGEQQKIIWFTTQDYYDTRNTSLSVIHCNDIWWYINSFQQKPAGRSPTPDGFSYDCHACGIRKYSAANECVFQCVHSWCPCALTSQYGHDELAGMWWMSAQGPACTPSDDISSTGNLVDPCSFLDVESLTPSSDWVF